MSLVSRFQPTRWSSTRRKMADMRPGDEITLPADEYYNAHSSAMRLSDAFTDRRWRASRKNGKLIVTCFTPP